MSTAMETRVAMVSTYWGAWSANTGVHGQHILGCTVSTYWGARSAHTGVHGQHILGYMVMPYTCRALGRMNHNKSHA